MKKQVTIDIVSDVVCPWCFIGKRRLEKAMRSLSNDYVFQIQWHPFELNPYVAEEGEDWLPMMKAKFGSESKLRQVFAHVTEIGKSEGINFHFEKITKAYRTLELHKILHLASQKGVQEALAERLFVAYFTEGKDLAATSVLAEILAPFGFSASELAQLQTDDNAAYEIRNAIQYFQSLGISGVPFYILNGKVGLSGAQPPEVFIEAIQSLKNVPLAEVEMCEVGSKC
jgi:predicted DsbA family dithiol-disulfide isomerase